MKIETLKRPGEFKRVRGGVRLATPLFIIEGRRRPEAAVDAAATGEAMPFAASGPRFGFTITRKVGPAVVRNKIRRRLKEALRTLEPSLMRRDHDYVVVASRATHDYPFAGLQDALRQAFDRLHRHAEGGAGRGRRKAAGAAGGSQSVPIESQPTDVDRPSAGDGVAGEDTGRPVGVPGNTAAGPRLARSARRRGR